jgi:ribose-phosphate pyrophosphokinase
VTTRYVAQLFEASGVDRVMVLDVHDPAAFDNAFRCETVRLDATALFVGHLAARLAGAEVAVATPDIGGAKRARRFQGQLELVLGRPVGFAFVDKQRMHDAVTGSLFAGEVAGRRVIIFDDLISTGATVARAIATIRRAGATRIEVAATHAAFAPEALLLGGAAGPDGLIVTDSIPLATEFSARLHPTLSVLSAAACFADAIRLLEPEYRWKTASCNSENPGGNSHDCPWP